MPRVEAVIFCDSYRRDEKGFLTLSGVFHTAPVANLPVAVNFKVVAFFSELAVGRTYSLHLEFVGPGLQGQMAQSQLIKDHNTQFYELTIDVNGFPVDAYGVYRLQIRFESSSRVSHVARFEVVQATILPPSLQSRSQH